MSLHIYPFSVWPHCMIAGVGTSEVVGRWLAGEGSWWNCLFQWYLTPVSAENDCGTTALI